MASLSDQVLALKTLRKLLKEAQDRSGKVTVPKIWSFKHAEHLARTIDPDPNSWSDDEWLSAGNIVAFAYEKAIAASCNEAIDTSSDLLFWESIAFSSIQLIYNGFTTLPLGILRCILQIIRGPFEAGKAWIARMDAWYRRERDAGLYPHPRPLLWFRQDCSEKIELLRRLQSRNARILGGLVAAGSWQTASNWKLCVAHAWVSLSQFVNVLESELAERQSLNDKAMHSFPEPEIDSYRTEKLDIATLCRREPGAIDLLRVSSIRKLARRPSKLMYRWPMFVLAGLATYKLFSGIYVNQQVIVNWLNGLSQTVHGFWSEWIVRPTKDIIDTIRRSNTEVQQALMSKRSLDVDVESLERMIVDFAVDHDRFFKDMQNENGVIDFDAVVQRTRSGDLSPILQAYEQDLRRPIVGALKGDLLRTLLIQIQKAKVDVEVAVLGIDRILQSQQLLLALLSISPSILIIVFVGAWLRRVLHGGFDPLKLKQPSATLRSLRRISKILAEQPRPEQPIEREQFGQMLCELLLLIKRAQEGKLFRGDESVKAEFIEDLLSLQDPNLTIQQQSELLRMIFNVYGRYI